MWSASEIHRAFLLLSQKGKSCVPNDVVVPNVPQIIPPHFSMDLPRILIA